MNFQSERLTFIPVTYENTEAVHDIFGDVTLTKYFASGHDKTFEDSVKRVDKVVNHWLDYSFGDYMIIDSKTFETVGYGGLHYKYSGGNINISYLVKQVYWGKGFGKEVCLALTHFGIDTLKLDTVYAEIDPNNLPSIKLIEACDYTYNETIHYEGYKRLVYTKSK